MTRDFSNYRDMQQRARLLVPEHPVQSRGADMERVWAQKQQEEERRAATLARLDRCAQERADRLQQTLSKVRDEGATRKQRPQPPPLTCLSPFSSSVVAEDTTSSAGASCSAGMTPASTSASAAAAAMACADATARASGTAGSAKFLGRRLDVNRVRLRQVQQVDEQRRMGQESLAREAKRLADVLEAIDEFEDALPSSRKTQDTSVIGRTSEDWTGTRPSRKPCAARLRAPCPEVTSSTGWNSTDTEEPTPSTPSRTRGKRRDRLEQGSTSRAASQPLL
eukprot:TRINITY_DN62244_c0_g1_i1.p1 TRINITY_DN62244_c0_g1~~TRINITY_DN62244_c0_g1_i1.p1  ORF type:complete len:290 (+),score=48.83 TRINITY_DN62244_c0_g1_i1:31-870(+)